MGFVTVRVVGRVVVRIRVGVRDKDRVSVRVAKSANPNSSSDPN